MSNFAKNKPVVAHFDSRAGPHLAVGKDDNNSEQIKFRLSDCVFEYGDFRDEESADKYEGFLVVASSKGDTLSLFEPKGWLALRLCMLRVRSGRSGALLFR